MVAKLPCWDLDSRKLPEPPVGASTNVQPSDMLSLDFVIDRLLDQEEELEYVSCRHLESTRLGIPHHGGNKTLVIATIPPNELSPAYPIHQ